MYARTTLLEIDTLPRLLDDAVAEFEAAVMPRLREQRGFLGLYALTTPAGRAMLITFWETADKPTTRYRGRLVPRGAGRVHDHVPVAARARAYEVRVAVPPHRLRAPTDRRPR